MLVAGGVNAYKALITAQYAGVDVQVAKDFQMGVTNRTPEFLKLNPTGKVWNEGTPESTEETGSMWLLRHTARCAADIC